MKGLSRAAALAVIALVGVPVAACATVRTTPGWEPRPAVQAELALSAEMPAPAPVDAAGLDVRLLYRSDPAAAVGARWAEIPGNDAFNGELRGLVRAALDAQSASTGVRYQPAAEGLPGSRTCSPGASTRPAAELLADPAVAPATGGPTVMIACEIVAASGPVLAEAVRVVATAGGEVQSDTTTVYYAETSGAFLVTSDRILSDQGLRGLLAAVVQSLKVGAGALEPQMKDDPAAFPLDQLREWFSNFTFGPGGSLVLHLPDTFSTPELDDLAEVPAPEPLIVSVPAAVAAPLLTAEGAAVQSALASGAPLVLPPAPRRGQEEVDCSFFACIALTFDDGPGPYTGEVLDALASRRSAATFFLQGAAVPRRADLVLRMRDEGQQIGNHSWNHPDLTTLAPSDVTSQITRTNAVIRSVTGAAPTVFRPPFGAYNGAVLAASPLPAILWSVDTNDWRVPGDELLLQRAVTNTVPGDIVLLHDVHQSTARMTPQIVDGLLDRGFTLVTVDQLLGGPPSPGSVTKR